MNRSRNPKIYLAVTRHVTRISNDDVCNFNALL
jgi:hypothetical protein